MPQSDHNNRRKAGKWGPKKPLEIRRLKKAVISSLAAGFSYTGAAEQVGTQRNTIKAWRDSDEQFDAACQDARESAIERVEDALYAAAKKVETDSKFTTAAIFYLKNRDPANWRDVKDFRHTNDIRQALENLPPDKLRRLADSLESLEEITEGEVKEEVPANG